MKSWTPRARITWAAIVLLGLVTLLLCARWRNTTPPSVRDGAVLAVLGAACVLLALRPIELAPDWKLNAVAAPGVALSLLADPFQAAAVAALAACIADVSLRRRWYVVVFGAAERALSIGVAAAIAGAFSRDPRLGSDLAPLAAAGAIFVTNSACISAISAARRRVAFFPSWRTVCRSEGLAEIGLLCGGALVAVLGRTAPAAIPLVVPPLLLAWHAFADSAKIRSLNERLEASVAAQRRFVADAAHELRTPTASARAQLDVVRSTLRAQGDVTPVIDGVDAALQRMSRLLADLLTLARVDDGAQITAAPVDLERVLMAVYREMRPFAAGVRLRLDIGEEGDSPIVLGDEERLRQLFVNLVANALRFTPAGGGVELRCRRHGRDVIVAVADTGTGIEPAAIGKIFDRFYSADPSRTRAEAAPGGAGLGLSIARWIAEAHHGEITVESTVDKGSTFTVRLPLMPAAAETAPVPMGVGLPETDAAG